MTPEAWSAAAAIVGSLSLAVSGVVIARVNAAHKTAAEARDEATQAKDFAQPTGNGYADRTIRALARIEEQQAAMSAAIRDVAERQARTNGWLTRHLSDHAQNDIAHHNREEP